MITHLYTICWNEADMLPFFFRHYDSWVDRYFIYDDGSDDGSLEILRAHPKVELRRFERTVEGSFALSHTRLQNAAWLESRGVADWVVITALDEHLFVRNTKMHRYLWEQKTIGVTYIPALGFNVIGESFPAGEARLVDAPLRAVASASFNKLSIFDPSAIETPGYLPGRHLASPKGSLLLPRRDDLLLFHFKNIGYERTRDREREQGKRLGSIDRSKRFAERYLWDEARFRQKWDDMNRRAFDVRSIPDVAIKGADGPFWWVSYRRA
jgi:hypothetical protein